MGQTLWLDNNLKFAGFQYNAFLRIKILMKELFKKNKQEIFVMLKFTFRTFFILERITNNTNKSLAESMEGLFLKDEIWVGRNVAINERLLFKSCDFEKRFWQAHSHLYILGIFRLGRRLNKEVLNSNCKVLNISTSSISSKQLSFQTVKNGIVVNGMYVTKENRLIANSSYFIDELSKEIPSMMPTIFSSGSIKSIIPMKTKKFEEAVFVGASLNYYHCIWEFLPRLIDIREYTERAIPAIVPAKLPHQLKEVYSIATNQKPIDCKIGEAIEVNALLIAFDGRYQERVNYHNWRKGNIFESRRKDLFKIRELVKYLDMEIIKTRHVLIQRPLLDVRTPVNQKQIESFLLKMGFEIIEPSQETFHNQVVLFKNMEYLVINSGASITNLAFSEKIKYVIILVGASEDDQAARVFWPQYLEFLGIAHSCIFLDKDRSIDLKRLKDTVTSKMDLD